MRNFFVFSSLLVCTVFLGAALDATTFNFGSRDSKISVATGSRLNVQSGSSISVDGTLSQDEGGFITGGPFKFYNGILDQAGAEACLYGLFDPSLRYSSTGQSICLLGSSSLKCEPGNVIYGVSASGVNNVISGQPTFTAPVIIEDSSSSLFLDMQNALSQNIELNSGIVKLLDDLSLGDGVKIIGPGIIDLNNRELALGSYYVDSWTGDLVFRDATNLVLTGSIKLDGTWYFGGNCNLSGNGAVLDLSGGGKIVLSSQTKLSVDDLVIKGLGSSAGSIIFSSDTSEMHISDVDVCFASSYTTTIGKIVVDGPSSFVLGSYYFNINTQANLTVDGVTLWLDTLGSGTDVGAGRLNASRAIYDEKGYNKANVSANIVDGTLKYLNGGYIKQSVTATGGFVDPAAAILLGGNVNIDVTMNYFIDVPSDGVMNFTGNMTLDGGGSTITFPDAGNAQFVVQPGVTVTLQNVTMMNINNDTFNILSGGQINIGENVVWGFSEDVTLDQPLINILSSGKLTMIGLDGVKYVTLDGSSVSNQYIVQLNDGTLTLNCIVLSGISYMKNSSDCLIDLQGDSGVNIDVDTDLNFKASRYDNSLILLTDALNLSGLIAFGDKSTNELHIAFALASGLATYRVLANERYPLLNISGGPGFIVGGSTSGTSRLIFDDPYVVLDLLDSNAMQLDVNSHIIYEELEVRDNPIKQLSTRVLDDGIQINGLKIDTSFIRSILSRDLKAVKVSKKDVIRKIVDEQEVGIVDKSDNEDDAILVDEPYFRAPIVKDPKKARKMLLMAERFAGFGKKQVNKVKKLVRTTIVEPTTFDQQYAGQRIDVSDAMSGNIEMRYSTDLNFFVDSSLDLDLFMKEGSTLWQAAQVVTLNSSRHKVNIVGKNNVINVQNVMHFNNNFFIAENSSVQFNFLSTGIEDKAVVFDAGCVIEIPQNSTLSFVGVGKVILSDGVIIKLVATEDAKTQTITNRSNLILGDGAVMDFASGAVATIEGIGNIIIKDTAAIQPTNPGTLVIGTSISDDINVNVSNSAQICLEASDIDGVARVSINKTAASIKFEQGGMLIVGENGIFELNALNGSISSGAITDISFKNNGYMNIKEGGTLILAPNRLSSKSMSSYDFSWGGLLSNITGGGKVIYLDTNTTKNITADVLALDSHLSIDIASTTFEDLALYLVNKEPEILTVSFLYTKPDGSVVVVTKNKVRATLLSGDTITGDNSSGSIFGISASKTKFTISIDGKRN